jgi:hypothetical protein
MAGAKAKPSPLPHGVEAEPGEWPCIARSAAQAAVPTFAAVPPPLETADTDEPIFADLFWETVDVWITDTKGDEK